MASIFDLIIARTNQGDVWTLSLPNIKGEGSERHVATRSNERLERFCKKHDEQGRGTFFCVSTIEPGQRRVKEHARQMVFLFADVDFKHIDLTPEEILELLLALPYPPSRIHFTGHGYHCFWMLTVAVKADEFERAEALLKKLAFLLGGDIQVTHRAALLRVPGSRNTKNPDEPKLVKVIRETNAIYDLDELDRWLTAASVPVIAKRGAVTNPFLQVADSQASRAPVDVKQRLRDMRVEGGDVNGVHPSLLAVSGSLTSKGTEEDEIVEMLLEATKRLEGTENWNWIAEERKIRGMCRDMRKKIEADKRKESTQRPGSLSAASAPRLADARKSPDELTDTAHEVSPAFSDDALALRFTERHPEVRYTAAWNKWMIFDGARWSVDDTNKVWSLARNICREASREINKDSAAKSIASSKTRSAVLSMASDDRRIAATVDQWDTDLWLLNTPAGSINLLDGTTGPHQAEDYATKVTSVAPDPNCPTPLFDGFLDKVTRSDNEYKAFLRRVCGYCLTGSTEEHAMFFLHGDGGNGKGVFMGTIMDIIGDYHRTAPIETFTDSKNERHSTELAMLRGARLVTATETEEGKGWAESKIKTLTGGDRISARFMRQDFFEYVPQFKLMISGNHKPTLKTVDDAIRRRFHLLPFTVKIPVEERDPQLREKLKQEWPGILAWMIKGCVEWQDQGLAPPSVVSAATAAYFESQDAIVMWIEEECVRDVNAFTTTADLFSAWVVWAESNGEVCGSSKRFSSRLEALGFRRDNQRRRGGRGFQGIKGPTVVPSRLTVLR